MRKGQLPVAGKRDPLAGLDRPFGEFLKIGYCPWNSGLRIADYLVLHDRTP